MLILLKLSCRFNIILIKILTECFVANCQANFTIFIEMQRRAKTILKDKIGGLIQTSRLIIKLQWLKQCGVSN